MKRVLICAFTLSMLFIISSCKTETPAQSYSDTSIQPSFSNSVDSDLSDDILGDNSAGANSDDISTGDNRTIPGMSAFVIKTLLEGEPFEIPFAEDIPAPPEAGETFAYSCSASSSSNSDILYDYSITMDSDKEIIGASFGITNVAASEQDLLLAADLYFYSIGILPYDTADKEVLTAWFEEHLASATEDGVEITVGDAKFTFYAIPKTMYWVDISKVI